MQKLQLTSNHLPAATFLWPLLMHAKFCHECCSLLRNSACYQRLCKIQFWFCTSGKIFSLIFILDAKFTFIVRVNMLPAAISPFRLLENIPGKQEIPWERDLLRP